MKLQLYTIRLCKHDEYDKLVDFFRKYWSEKHVFCRNKEIFEFQHVDASDGAYDFIIAEHNETGEIHAVLGYISFSRYDGGSMEKPEAISGAIWKVRDDVQNKEIGKLGLGVLYYLLKKFPDSAYTTLGLSKFSQSIYDALHFDFGVMGHYYIASNSVDDFYIADKPAINKNAIVNEEYVIECIEDVPEGFDSYYYPLKNSEYIRNRYILHPFYKYRLLCIYKNNKPIVIWVVRLIDVDDHKCLRLVDMIGNLEAVSNIEGNIQDILRDYSAEYIDCYNHGISSEVFSRVGFSCVEGDTVIPNYFEPFEKKNIDICYAALSKNPVILFKGDCDQDRPNLLEL